MRIDKLLWQLRFTKTRGLAQALVLQGHVRRNGARVLRASQDVVQGDTLTLPLPGGVRVIELLALPARRGPPAEAQACYRALDPNAIPAIAPAEPTTPGRGPPQ
ncbi:RNA-binding S4 domain-containing protein [Altererythrobacter sp. TH136]|uniref:RNA-binding S4 domain-containing protein n=1 Tax=Altererythrobacter sp. TH136 TaxID=2067415 RepID=UPI0011639DB3|nr:RNA-binding S4 domain-containing protein [Altererythrobacter sp. TH136]QDM41053.1 RNA-binding S4 domain-containing protein [Altererythrobacter sp. TH136]